VTSLETASRIAKEQSMSDSMKWGGGKDGKRSGWQKKRKILRSGKVIRAAKKQTSKMSERLVQRTWSRTSHWNEKKTGVSE